MPENGHSSGTRASYADLLARSDAPPGSSWGLFPGGGERGTADLATPERVLDAVWFVRSGIAIGLDHPLGAFDPSVANRTPPEHTITSTHADQRDDYLDRFWLQGSSHVDGLRHRRHNTHGFYGGVPDHVIAPGTPALGVNRWAERPIVGRGVLIDVAGDRAVRGRPIDHAGGEHLRVGDLDRALERQGTTLARGDIALIRTGWAEWYLGEIDDAERARICAERRCTGLAQGHDTLAWLWNHGLAVAASDTFALEALPAAPDSPFGGSTDHGMMHQELIALLGLVVGELWKLDELAAVCAADGVYESLVVIKPLNLTGGVGSPANAVALR
jgi:kynurenine formamidase